LLDGHAAINSAQSIHAFGGMTPIRHDYKSMWPTGMLQKGSDRCNLFRQSSFAGISKHIERRPGGEWKTPAHDLRQENAIERLEKTSLRPSQVIPIIRHDR
jgi:hypothetical protein